MYMYLVYFIELLKDFGLPECAEWLQFCAFPWSEAHAVFPVFLWEADRTRPVCVGKLMGFSGEL